MTRPTLLFHDRAKALQTSREELATFVFLLELIKSRSRQGKTISTQMHIEIPAVFDVQKFVDMLRVNLKKTDSTERAITIEQTPSYGLTHAFVISEFHAGDFKGRVIVRHCSTFELVKDVDRYWILEVVNDMTCPMK